MVHRRLSMRLRLISVATLLMVWALLSPSATYAGSPFDDPTFQPPEGGTISTTEPHASSVSLPALPAGYTEMVPPSSIAAISARGPLLQQGGNPSPNDPLAWLSLTYNPGKWLLDSVLGALSAVLLSISSILQSVAIWAFGPAVTPSTSAALSVQANTASATTIRGEGIVFSTPTRFTTAPSGISSATQTAHDIVLKATISIMVLVFLFRCLQLLTSPSLHEGRKLAIAFFSSMVMTLGSWGICDLMIKAANIIGAEIARHYTFWDGTMLFPFADVTSSATGLYLTVTLVGVCYWGLFAVLVFKAVARIALVNLLIIISPVTGLGVLSGGWNYAAVWFFRMVELLATPLAWLIVLGFLRNLLLAFTWSSPLIPYVMSCFVLFITPRAPAILGLAAREAWNRGTTIPALVTRVVAAAAA
jgi:hypothetical protein